MSFPDRNNPYNFDRLLNWRQNVDYYKDDPFIQKMAASRDGTDVIRDAMPCPYSADTASWRISHRCRASTAIPPLTNCGRGGKMFC